jgi:putative ABC transport system permease protein
MNWIRAVFSRRRIYSEMAEDVRSHLEEKREELVARGMSREEAEFAARREFGNLGLVEREAKEVWRWGGLEDVWGDVRFGMRMLVKSPGFTAIAVAALALGIGANTAIYTIVRGALSWDMGLDDHERVVILNETNTSRSQQWGLSYPDYQEFRVNMKSMEGLAAYRITAVNVNDHSKLAERYDCAQISANGLPLAGQKPVVGRDFATTDEDPGAPAAVILGYHVWRDRYALDPSIVGQTIRVDEIPRVVIGVMPPGRRFPEETDIWTPLLRDAEHGRRDARDLMVFGRLRRNVSMASARAEASTLAARLATQYLDTNKDVTAEVRPIIEITGLHFMRPLFLALYGAVGFVLLIACADVANMLLAKADERSREISVRIALGAGKRRIVRQLLLENAALAGAGGFFGWLIALGGLRWFESGLGGMEKPVWLHLSMDHRALLYLALVSAGTAILFGLAPALQLSKMNVNEGLKELGNHGIAGAAAATRLSNVIVALQIALCTTLLTGGGLMIRSVKNLYSTPVGVDSANVLTMRITLPVKKYQSATQWMNFHEELKKRVDALPGVEASSVTSNLPLSGWTPFSVMLGGMNQDGAKPEDLGGLIVGSDYFRTMNVKPLRGRVFDESDGVSGTPVVVVNESFAAKYFVREEPLGKRIRLVEGGAAGPWLTVAGVVPDILQNSREKARRDSLIYLPFAERPVSQFFLVARTLVPPGNLGGAIREEVRQVDENLAAYDIRTLEQHIAEGRLTVKLFGAICSIFAGVATLLAAIGLYGVVAHGVNRRRREIGVRIAMGAERDDVLKLVLGQAARALVPGLAIGVLLALATARALRGALVGVSPTDPITFVGVELLLIFAALLACWIPARRAMRVDPMVALRHE